MDNNNSYSRGLVDAAAKGNLSAVTALYNLSYEYVYRSLKVMIADESIIMDVAQDAYIRAYTNLVNLADPNKFPDLVRSLAVPDAKIMLVRKYPKLFTEASDETNIDFKDDRGSAIPDSVIDASETIGLMEELLSGLNQEQRLSIALFYYEKLSINEISSKINIPESKVKSLINSSRELINNVVEDLVKRGANLYGMSATQLLRVIFKSFELQPVKPPFKAATFETIRFGLGSQFFSQKPPTVKMQEKAPQNPDSDKNNVKVVSSPDSDKEEAASNNLKDVFSSSNDAKDEPKPISPIEFEDPDDYEIKKNKKHLLTLIVFIILLLSVAAGAAGALMLYQHQQSNDAIVGTKEDGYSSSIESSATTEISKEASDEEIEITVTAEESSTASLPPILTEESEGKTEDSKNDNKTNSREESVDESVNPTKKPTPTEEPEEESEESSFENSEYSSDISLLKDWNSDYYRNDGERVCFGFTDLNGPFDVLWLHNEEVNSFARVSGELTDNAIVCDFSAFAEGAKATIYVCDNTIHVKCNDAFKNTGFSTLDGTYTIQ